MVRCRCKQQLSKAVHGTEVRASRLGLALNPAALHERRLKNNKKWAKDYYVRHADDIKQKKLIAGIARGRCPNKTTLERLEQRSTVKVAGTW
eukprot:1564477-Prymnesium_polylepis.1